MTSSFIGLATALAVAASSGAIAQTVVAANTVLVSPDANQVHGLRKDLDPGSGLGGSGRMSTFMAGRYGSQDWVVTSRMLSLVIGQGVSQPEALQALDLASGN